MDIGQATVRIRADLPGLASDLNVARDMVARFEAGATQGYGAASRAATTFGRDGERAALQVAHANDNITSSAHRASSALSGVTAQLRHWLAFIGIGLGAREVIHLASAWTDLQSRVQLVTGTQETAIEVMDRLRVVADRTYSSFELTAETFLLNEQILSELGYTTQQTLDFTEALNNALVVSGAKGERAAAVQRGLSQAMAFGVLQGNNLHSVLEKGGRITELLAEELDVTTNELRRLGAEGRITSDVIASALLGNFEELRQAANDMPATIEDAFVRMRNAFMAFLGNIENSSGVFGTIANAIIFLSENLDLVAGALAVLATLMTARAIVGFATMIWAQVAALRAEAAGVAAVAAALNVATGSATALSVATRFLFGLPGIVLAGIVGAFIAWNNRARELVPTLEAQQTIAEGIRDAIEGAADAQERLADAGRVALGDAVLAATERQAATTSAAYFQIRELLDEIQLGAGFDEMPAFFRGMFDILAGDAADLQMGLVPLELYLDRVGQIGTATAEAAAAGDPWAVSIHNIALAMEAAGGAIEEANRNLAAQLNAFEEAGGVLTEAQAAFRDLWLAVEGGGGTQVNFHAAETLVRELEQAMGSIGEALRLGTTETVEAQIREVMTRIQAMLTRELEAIGDEVGAIFQSTLNSNIERGIRVELLGIIDDFRTGLAAGTADVDDFREAISTLRNLHPENEALVTIIDSLLELTNTASFLQRGLGRGVTAIRQIGTAAFEEDKKLTEFNESLQELIAAFDSQPGKDVILAIYEMGAAAATSAAQLAILAKARDAALGAMEVEPTIIQPPAPEGWKTATDTGGGTPSLPFDEMMQDVRERIQMLELERDTLGMTAEAASAYRIEHELIAAAYEQGVELTPEVLASIRGLAGAYAAVEEEIRAAEAAQADLEARVAEWAALFREVLGGFINDLREGKTVMEAMANVADRLIDKLVDVGLKFAELAFDMFLQALIGGGGFGGGSFFSRLFGGGKADGGLITGPGGPRSDSILARVSAGEFVVNAAATAANLPLLQAINSSRRYADGGMVNSFPSMGNGGMQISVKLNNQSGQPLKVSQQGPAQFDGKAMVLGLTLQALNDGQLDGPFMSRFGIAPRSRRGG